MSIRGTLFSAYAEVFPKDQLVMAWVLAFLCLRRGVSTDSVSTLAKWILFSAYAEVFLFSAAAVAVTSPFLCLRRGVSHAFSEKKSETIFSLPTQRCFYPAESPSVIAELFSAYAEVFLSRDYCAYGGSAFLCLRRGVSVS